MSAEKKAESQVTLTSRSGMTIIRNPPWWNRRSRLERALVLVAGSCVAIALSLAVALGTVLTKSNSSSPTDFNHAAPSLAEALTLDQSLPSAPGRGLLEGKPDQLSDLCLTEGCVQTAAQILQNLDQTVRPCDNFYNFACGGFNQRTVIPDDKTQMTTFAILSDKLDEQLRLLVESPVAVNEPTPFKLIKNLYKSCMNKTLIESLGLEPLKVILQELGGWPVVDGDSWDPANFTWINSVYKFRNKGYSVDYFIDFSITTDVKNSTYRVIDVDQPGLGLSREYIMKGLQDKDVQSYLKYQVRIAQLLGADPIRAKEELTESLKFEMQLANFSLPREERRNATKLYNPMTIAELQTKYQSIPWLEYMNTLLAGKVVINQDELIIVDVPSYFEKFQKLMSETPKRIQANYVMWRAAAASISYLTDEARVIQLDYSRALTGRAAREPRWKECVGVASGSLANAVGALYVRKHFKESARQSALRMVTDIRKSFMEVLDEIDWMDDGTKDKAKNKALSMDSHIGYPVELLDDNKLVELYEGLEMDSTSYLENVMNMTKFGTNYAFSKLREKVNKTDWISHGRPAIINAFYSPLENSIQFPAGILQGVFFSDDRPKYMNYGAIGWVIGHEITHGFDDQGRQFDKEGNLVDWWDKGTQSKYLLKAQCIISQYGNYTAEPIGLNLNGINTQGENIADNGGIKESYKAYQEWVENYGPEKLLPGLNYTQNQLFWISAANVWCNKYRPETLKLRILTGVHSPGEFRVRGPMSNMPEFSKDFQCEANAAMNPVNKCAVW